MVLRPLSPHLLPMLEWIINMLLLKRLIFFDLHLLSQVEYYPPPFNEIHFSRFLGLHNHYDHHSSLCGVSLLSEDQRSFLLVLPWPCEVFDLLFFFLSSLSLLYRHYVKGQQFYHLTSLCLESGKIKPQKHFTLICLSEENLKNLRTCKVIF